MGPVGRSDTEADEREVGFRGLGSIEMLPRVAAT
jgi:hypothetical protein